MYFRYYCTGGSEISTPTNDHSGGLCPPGHYCPSGSVSPVPCPPGTYTLQNGATECNICPAGKYCLPGMIPHLCPRGKWTEILDSTLSLFCSVHSGYWLLNKA